MEFCKLDVQIDDPIQHLELFFNEIVFGDGHIVFANNSSGASVGHSHKGLIYVGSIVNDLSGSVPM